MDVTNIQNGDYIKVKSVDFGTGALAFAARVASAGSGGNIELHLDSLTSSAIGSCAVTGTGGAQTWTTVSTGAVTGATGVHDLFFKFTGGSGDLFNFNWWQFTPKDPLDGGVTEAGGSTSTGSSGTASSMASGSDSGTGSGSTSTASRTATGTSTGDAGSTGTTSSGQMSGAGTSSDNAAPSGAGSRGGCSCRSAPGSGPGVTITMLAALPLFAGLRRGRRVAFWRR